MTFTRAADVARKSQHSLSPEYSQAIEDVLEAAAEWAAGAMPWNVAATIGDIDRLTEAGTWRRSPAYTRAVAMHHTEITDPRWRNLFDLCGVICKMQGMIETAFGLFEPNEMHQHDAAVRFVMDRAPWEGRAA